MIPTPAGEYKLVLVGDSAVGKSSLLNQFVDGKFDDRLLSTIGVDFKFRRVKVAKEQIKLQIWDTAGQETFRSIVSAYYNSADGIVLCYDTSSYESYESLKEYWLPEAENHNKEGARIFILGTKIDLQQKREVEAFSLEPLKEGHNITKFYEVSAKTNTNIEETFADIARLLHSKGNEVKEKKEAKKVVALNAERRNQPDQGNVVPYKKPCCK